MNGRGIANAEAHENAAGAHAAGLEPGGNHERIGPRSRPNGAAGGQGRGPRGRRGQVRDIFML